jgi:hypothetical protein
MFFNGLDRRFSAGSDISGKKMGAAGIVERRATIRSRWQSRPTDSIALRGWSR